MRVLLTGNRGYIGSVMGPMLQAKGHEVVGLDAGLYEACSFGQEPVDIPTVFKDVRDVDTSDLADTEAVIHLGNLSNDPLSELDPELTYQINHHGSVRLAQIAKSAGIKQFIYSSSCSVYGASGEDMVDESSSLEPMSCYAESKLRAERDIVKLADANFSPTFMRSATACGASARLRFDLVLNNLMAWAFTTGLVYLKSDGSAWRPIVHVRDICRAFIGVLESPRELVHGEVFNVGCTNENYKVRDLAKIVAETVSGSKVEFAVGASCDKRSYRVNCEKIVRTLKNYQPRWTPRETAKELLGVYRKYGLALEDFEGTKYKRVAHIRKLLSEGVLDKNLRRVIVPEMGGRKVANYVQRATS